jgi:hypothetical protein
LLEISITHFLIPRPPFEKGGKKGIFGQHFRFFGALFLNNNFSQRKINLRRNQGDQKWRIFQRS